MLTSGNIILKLNKFFIQNSPDKKSCTYIYKSADLSVSKKSSSPAYFSQNSISKQSSLHTVIKMLEPIHQDYCTGKGFKPPKGLCFGGMVLSV
jgi:hypothetical protein